MSIVRGKMKSGSVVFDTPINWPDGCDVNVEKVDEEVGIGIRDEDWPTTPEGIAEWLRWADSIEPLIFTPEEEVDFKAALQEQKAFQLATWDERCRKIEKMFE